ncbi:hypothetical protein BLS_007627 [Venturia inaequalis]|uniref:Proteasome maturation factor UMP1 n=1 Tax=Venturia inaequalis TaxID=5025 RepID=A0A8H3VUG9_VENIN|nr:hypothetical protein BLS_007627 [Venturia inaequalis]KAE9972480.1 hypothetical protein EG328_004952 [Venturia inaequalis]KAE9994281.1 hypothetical protein EG327_000126 [Venturia inaequalis]RDI81948.1 hypothetical protein Vi05172_g8101 [Venturia inaequalis]
MALRIVPSKASASSTTQHAGAPSAPGIHDTLRANNALTNPLVSSTGSAQAHQLQSSHPLEQRLTAWRSTQDALKMQLLRRQFGIAEPVRRGMELKIAREGEWRPRMLGYASTVSSDILAGRDEEVGWEDIFVGDELRDVPDFHTEMEGRMKMNW